MANFAMMCESSNSPWYLVAGSCGGRGEGGGREGVGGTGEGEGERERGRKGRGGKGEGRWRGEKMYSFATVI